jgi:hypothetical protein
MLSAVIEMAKSSSLSDSKLTNAAEVSQLSLNIYFLLKNAEKGRVVTKNAMTLKKFKS